MSTLKLRIGQWVKFQGIRGVNGDLVAVHPVGRDTFMAKITSKPYGACYALSWADGSPVGLPFHDCQLEPADVYEPVVLDKRDRRGTGEHMLNESEEGS